MSTQNLERLAALIESERAALLSRWREQVRQLPSAKHLDTPTLNDHVPALLDELATAFQWVTSKERAERCTSKLAVGLTELSIPQTMVGLRIGPVALDTVPTGLHRKAIFPGESGLLGNGLLAQFEVVTIDAKVGRLFLGRSPDR